MTAIQTFENYLKQKCGEKHMSLHPEYRFDEKRRFRFDYAIPEKLVAFEYEGGIWNNGGHVRGAGYSSNCDKYNIAALRGWRVYRFTCASFSKEKISYTLDFIDNIFDILEQK